MARIYVEIPKSVGDLHTSISSASYAQMAASGASLGALAGSVIPGLGNAAGTAIGGAAGFLGRLVGIGSGRDEVRDLTRKVIGETMGQIMPGRVSYVGDRVPSLIGKYRPQDIETILREIGNKLAQSLEPGSDAYGDMTLAFRSFNFNTSDRADQYVVLYFDAVSDQTGAGKNATDSTGNTGLFGGSGTAGREPGIVTGPGLLAGIPMLGWGLIAAGAFVFFSR